MHFLPAPRRWPWLATAALILAGCAQGPAPAGDPTVASDDRSVDYLRGVDSAYSVRLQSLGNAELLGPDSVMRKALVAGDEELYVAATVFEREGVFTLDIIIVNHSGHDVQLLRDGLHLVDADGRWLSRVQDQPGAELYGLRGRQQVDTPAVVYDVPDRDNELSRGLALHSSANFDDAKPRKRDAKATDQRRQKRADDAFLDSTSAPVGSVLETPTAVRVRDGDGRPFWTYFSAEEATYPLTAVVMLEDQQLLFKFEN